MSKISREEVAEKVKNILCDKLGLISEQVDSEKNKLTDDLGADSLDAVEIIMEFEKEFSVVIPDGKAEKIKTIKDCIETVLICLENCK